MDRRGGDLMISGLFRRWWHCLVGTLRYCFAGGTEFHCYVDMSRDGKRTWIGCECGKEFWSSDGGDDERD